METPAHKCSNFLRRVFEYCANSCDLICTHQAEALIKTSWEVCGDALGGPGPPPRTCQSTISLSKHLCNTSNCLASFPARPSPPLLQVHSQAKHAVAT